MRKVIKRSAQFAVGIVVVVLAPALAINNPRASGPKINEEPGDWESVARRAEAIDAAIVTHWSQSGVAPQTAVDDLHRLRRLHLALTGCIPSLEEIREFESTSGRDRLRRWTDRLLADPRHHDYLAERLARAMVSSLPVEPFFIYRRRRFVAWLSGQLAANRPYDELVFEILSSEGLWTDNPATNFITSEEMDATRLANRTSRAFLGLRLDCAECHDHPFTDWTQEDFQGLAAYFSQCDFGFQGVKDRRGKLHFIQGTNAERVRIDPRPPFDPPIPDTAPRRRVQLAHWVTSEENPYFAKAIANRLWRLLFGQGLIEPVDDLQETERLPGVLDELAADFKTNGYDLRRLIRVITSTYAFGAQSALAGDVDPDTEYLFAAYPLTRLRPEQIAASLVQSSSVQAHDRERNLFARFAAFANRNDFIEGFGDSGEDELSERDGNIPQRLLLMNGKISKDRLEANPFSAAGRIAMLAPDDDACIKAAYLICLCRRPHPEERSHFRERLAATKGEQRQRAVEDMMWALVNSTEFSWSY